MFCFNQKFIRMLRVLLIKIFRLSIIKSLILLILSIYFFELVIELLSHIFPITPPHNEAKYSLQLTIIIVCVLAPIVETYIIQYLVYDILGEKLKKKIICLCLISGIIFGLFHYYSIEYIVAATYVGFCLQLWYILLARRHGKLKAFFCITGVHALNNTIATIIVFC